MQLKFHHSHELLAPYLFMFSHLIIDADELERTKFLPDNNTSLTLFLSEKPKVYDAFRDIHVNHRITFAGQYTGPVLYSRNEPLEIINIDFNPWGAYAIFGINQQQLANKTFDATEVLPGLINIKSELENNLKNPEACITLLENYLLNCLATNKNLIDPRIIEACKAITKADGNVQVKMLCKQIGISHSGLTNYFNQMIGVTPKMYSKTARFNAMHNFLAQNATAGWTDLAYHFNYFDQNHFIREFKLFTGFTPKETKHWEALFDPLKKAINEGFATNEKKMKAYRDASLALILYNRGSL